METSVLLSTKKILGVSEDYTAFDLDILTHINAAFSVVYQIGVTDVPITVEDDETSWADLGIPDEQLNLVRSYIFLKVKMLFDPPTIGYLIDATNKQIEEFETRLSYYRENAIPIPVEEPVPQD